MIVNYVQLDDSRGVSFSALQSDVKNLEVNYPAYKKKIRVWVDQDLARDRVLISSQIKRIQTIFDFYAKSNIQPDDEALLENLQVRFTTMSREFPILDQEPAEAKAQLLLMERRSKCIKIGIPCLIIMTLAAAILVTLHYTLKNSGGP